MKPGVLPAPGVHSRDPAPIPGPLWLCFHQGGVWNGWGLKGPALSKPGQGHKAVRASRHGGGVYGSGLYSGLEIQPKVARYLNFLKETRNQIFICNLLLIHVGN